jgi:hypothetical protein
MRTSINEKESFMNDLITEYVLNGAALTGQYPDACNDKKVGKL